MSGNLEAAEPLRDDRYERFAQLRVIGVPCQAAAWEAGFRTQSGTRKGQAIQPYNAARLDRRADVRARKAYLAGDEREVIIATRNFVRDRLINWATLDLLGRFAVIEESEIDGCKTMRVVGINWQALKESEQSGAIIGFKFDRETGVMTEFKCVDPDGAVAQLRDMYGLRAPRRDRLELESASNDGDDITINVNFVKPKEIVE